LWRELRAAGIAVVCIDARHAQAALSMRLNKSDRNDAAGLAQLLRMGWYREVQVKQLSAHGDAALLANRMLLVRHRCELENQIRGLMKNFGLRPTATKGRAFGQSVEALATRNAALKDIVIALLAAWSQLRMQIAVLSRGVKERANGSATCRRLLCGDR
jgi:transposase